MDGATPAERVFRAHLAGGPFQSGVARGRWRLLSIEWPVAVIAVSAAPRDGAPGEYAFRFECTDYPQSPATAQPWDLERDTLLPPHQCPWGTQRIQLAFRVDWNNRKGLYLACDREAINSHSNWRTEHPFDLWDPELGIVKYLRIIHALLNSREYSGVHGT